MYDKENEIFIWIAWPCLGELFLRKFLYGQITPSLTHADLILKLIYIILYFIIFYIIYAITIKTKTKMTLSDLKRKFISKFKRLVDLLYMFKMWVHVERFRLLRQLSWLSWLAAGQDWLQTYINDKTTLINFKSKFRHLKI